MISLNQISKTYQAKGKLPVEAVRNASLDIERGEFVVINGRSGSGKTTLLNLAAGLAEPSAGEVLVDGINIWELTDPKRSGLRNREMGFVFQFPSLMPSLTVLENVVLPTIFGKNNNNENGVTERAEKLLDEVGLADKKSAYPRQLSAGQQQRVVVARALINEPAVLLADEPTSNLDEQSEKEIIALFQDIHAKNGITILLVTHSSKMVTSATRLVTMAGGAIVKNQILNNLETHSGKKITKKQKQ